MPRGANLEVKEDQDYFYAEANSPWISRTKLIPYSSEDITIEEEIYDEKEDTADVNPIALDNFINRILLSATLSQEEGSAEYGISKY